MQLPQILRGCGFRNYVFWRPNEAHKELPKPLFDWVGLDGSSVRCYRLGGKGGEIFVFDMGKPVKIVDLAKRMIALSGATDVEIKFTGLRDGEKLYEEVLNDKEGTIPTSNPKIMVAKVREYDYATACANEERLLEVSKSFDDMAIVRVMKDIVPEYKSRQSKYEVLDN